QLEGNRKAIDDALETLTDLIDASEGRMWLARIKELRARYVVVSAAVLQLMEARRPDQAAKLMNTEGLPVLDAIQAPIKALLASQKRSMPVGSAGAKQQIDSALTLMTVLDGAPSAVWQSSMRGEP
ncbi:MAG: MCP four helix bundle domain-containing protein, partial [Betaproteobacteria bacterium]|nr:MCP four helix bundle domain-containing protein [Betaproteobacteria bacterium]